MKRRLLESAAKSAAAGGAAVVLCLGAQAALAAPQPAVTVPCHASDLSSAISAAPSGATLNLTSGCTYNLTAWLPNITKTLTINGHGATVERSYARDTPQLVIFEVYANGGNLHLIDLNVRHGGGPAEAHGGAIDNDGVLAIDGGTFSDSQGGRDGGAILNDGTLTIANATFLDNAGRYGGAIYSDDNLTVTGTAFTGNTSPHGEGGAIYTDASATITGDNFTGNGAALGGAVYNRAQTTVSQSFFRHNTSSYGGAIYNDKGTLSIQHDVISFNSATRQGGGIYNGADITIFRTFIRLNSAARSGVGGGGGLYREGASSVTLDFAHIFGNRPNNCKPVNAIAGCRN